MKNCLLWWLCYGPYSQGCRWHSLLQGCASDMYSTCSSAMLHPQKFFSISSWECTVAWAYSTQEPEFYIWLCSPSWGFFQPISPSFHGPSQWAMSFTVQTTPTSVCYHLQICWVLATPSCRSLIVRWNLISLCINAWGVPLVGGHQFNSVSKIRS